MTSDFHLSGRYWPVSSRFLRRGTFIIDLVNQQVTINNKQIQLPGCAFECLVLLVRNSPKPVSFVDLAQATPGPLLSQVDIQDKARLHIYILKTVFEHNQESSSRIRAVPGYGYWLKTY